MKQINFDGTTDEAIKQGKSKEIKFLLDDLISKLVKTLASLLI